MHSLMELILYSLQFVFVVIIQGVKTSSHPLFLNGSYLNLKLLQKGLATFPCNYIWVILLSYIIEKYMCLCMALCNPASCFAILYFFGLFCIFKPFPTYQNRVVAIFPPACMAAINGRFIQGSKNQVESMCHLVRLKMYGFL